MPSTVVSLGFAVGKGGKGGNVFCDFVAAEETV
jgi:hypothetical protein